MKAAMTMSENAKNEPKSEAPPSKQDARAARQAEALRANLRRRKAQSRARKDTSSSPSQS